MDEHGPGAVVDSPAIFIEPDPRRFGDLGHLLREDRLAWRRILDLEQFAREAVEVVDGAWARGIAVTAEALIYQWAEATRIARGRGTLAPKALHASVYRLRSSAFIGLPWPRKAAGMRVRAAWLVLSVMRCLARGLLLCHHGGPRSAVAERRHS